MTAFNETQSNANAAPLPRRYPIRSKFFANRVIRLLGKTCAAQEIGTTGFCLVVWIAMTEDASGYRRTVTFYDTQLMPIVGAQSQKTLALARSKAVSAGWLDYVPGCKGRAGSYYVTIPEYALGLDDAPSDESHDNRRGESHANFTSKPTSNREQSDVELDDDSEAILRGKGQPFLPTPTPSPSPSPKNEPLIAESFPVLGTAEAAEDRRSRNAIRTRTAKVFVPPTVEEVRQYCIECGSTVDPAHFVDHYVANGWMSGSSRLKDWKAALRNWGRRNFKAIAPKANAFSGTKAFLEKEIS